MTELVENPWLNISWENSIADIDMEYLAKVIGGWLALLSAISLAGISFGL